MSVRRAYGRFGPDAKAGAADVRHAENLTPAHLHEGMACVLASVAVAPSSSSQIDEVPALAPQRGLFLSEDGSARPRTGSSI